MYESKIVQMNRHKRQVHTITSIAQNKHMNTFSGVRFIDLNLQNCHKRSGQYYF